jgi:hypothetical protein
MVIARYRYLRDRIVHFASSARRTNGNLSLPYMERGILHIPQRKRQLASEVADFFIFVTGVRERGGSSNRGV